MHFISVPLAIAVPVLATGASALLTEDELAPPVPAPAKVLLSIMTIVRNWYRGSTHVFSESNG